MRNGRVVQSDFTSEQKLTNQRKGVKLQEHYKGKRLNWTHKVLHGLHDYSEAFDLVQHGQDLGQSNKDDKFEFLDNRVEGGGKLDLGF